MGLRTVLRFALISACAIFAVILLFEIVFSFGFSARSDVFAQNPQIARPDSRRADRLAAQILKRPLFTRGREPPELRIPKKEPPKLQGRLAGLMMRPDVREALFTRPGGRPVAVKEGDTIDGWKIASIQFDRVLLTSEFGEQVVKPTKGTEEEETAVRRPKVIKKTAPTQAPPKANPAAATQKASLPTKAQQFSQAAAQAVSTGP